MKYELNNAGAKRLAVMTYLREENQKFNDGWRPIGCITNATGVSPRDMRALSNMFPQTFLGGNRGYKLVSMASLDEVNDALRVLMSRAESVMHRARSLQRYALERAKVETRSRVA